jgi:hypothetical protein
VKLLLPTQQRWKAKIGWSVVEVARTIGADKVPTASDDEKCLLSPGGTDNSLGEGASDDENSWTYNFRTSTITIGRMKEMVEKGYFVDGEARTPRLKRCRSRIATKLACMKVSLLPAYTCLCI